MLRRIGANFNLPGDALRRNHAACLAVSSAYTHAVDSHTLREDENADSEHNANHADNDTRGVSSSWPTPLLYHR